MGDLFIDISAQYQHPDLTTVTLLYYPIILYRADGVT